MRRFDLAHQDGRHFRLAKCAPLPWPYIRLEYIESHGTEYINSGVVPTDTTGMLVDFQLTGVVSSDNYINGVRYGTDGRFAIGVLETGNYLGFASQIIRGKLPSLDKVHIELNFLNNRLAKYDDLVTEITSTLPTFGAGYSIFLFGRKSSIGAEISLYPQRIYKFIITDGSAMLRNFIPCWNLKTKTAGLYDLVTQSFYGNSGTGNFTDGPEVNPFMQLAAANH